jgi:DNA anti-recombination protein RmuC
MINMENNVKNLYTDFDAISENNAEKIASLVRTLSTQATQSGEKKSNLHTQIKRTKTSFAKRILCCLKIS